MPSPQLQVLARVNWNIAGGAETRDLRPPVNELWTIQGFMMVNTINSTSGAEGQTDLVLKDVAIPANDMLLDATNGPDGVVTENNKNFGGKPTSFVASVASMLGVTLSNNDYLELELTKPANGTNIGQAYLTGLRRILP